MKTLPIAAGILFLSAAGATFAQQPNPHAGHGSTATAATAPSTAEYEAANARMHQAMAIKYSGNADVDFARAMIPHHQGAIDMARIELKHGTDPELKKLAEEVMAAQEKEIAFLRDWLKSKGL